MDPDMPVATALVSEWQRMDSAPHGSKCLLLTAGGVAVVGIAPRPSLTLGYVAWAPLPKRPEWLKAGG
jgi:hypothetical protein